MDRKLFNFKSIAMVAVFSIVAFIGFNSFINKAETGKKFDTVYWFHVNTSGTTVSTYIGDSTGGLPTGCDQLTGSDYCALGFDASDVEFDIDGITVIGLKSAAVSNPLAEKVDQRFVDPQ